MAIRKRYSRRGRPPLNRPAIDKGTPELAAKRERGMTTITLDRLFKAGRLTSQELQCALRFRRLYTARFGSPHVRAVDVSRPPGFTIRNEERPQDAHIQIEYRHAICALEEKGVLNEVLGLAVFDEPIDNTSEVAQRAIQGLQTLAHHWGRPLIPLR